MTDESATDEAAGDHDPADLAAVATRAVQAGGEYLRERFTSGALDAEYSPRDVKTEADHAAERRILEVIDGAHPTHAVSAEESGERGGEGAYRWVVDPLDGTNNFAAGIPTFGSAVTATDGTGPLATAVAVPVLEDRYVATRGGGVRYNGDPVAVADGDTVPPSHATVGMIIGQPVISGGRERREWDAVSDAVDGLAKRAIQTWAPVVYWGLFARGRLDGFVCYYPAEREQVAGALLAREAGAVERSDGPLTVFGADDRTADALYETAVDALDEV